VEKPENRKLRMENGKTMKREGEDIE